MQRFHLKVFASALAIVIGGAVIGSQTDIEVSIDVSASRHPIDPRIYGVAFADAAALADLRVPLNRQGGNVASRYNWRANASNRASDWYFESIAEGPDVPGASADAFISEAKANGAEPLITVPLLPWVAKVGPSRNKLSSFSIAKYGRQTGVDTQSFPDAGNGVSATTGQNITGNDPNDANVRSDAAFQRGWIQHILSRWGASGSGGVRYYALDNEPSLWHSTHRDVHPAGATMGEVFNAAVAHATQIKALDPAALIMGPEEWGWPGYTYSGADQQWAATHGWNNLPDRTAHGNADYVPWYLDQMRRRDQAAGLRLLDILSLHFYPQSGQNSDDTSTAMQQLRNRSTRALWDPAYVDESWINAKVQLIRLMKNMAALYYPGTKIGITEYSWGAVNHINGATTQADILGIFGRERLDLATIWISPPATTPLYKAFKMYRNYDGQGSAFGDISVSAVAPGPDSLSVFAAQRGTGGALTIMAINKSLSNSPSVNFRLAGFTGSGVAQAWRLTSSNAITRLADATFSDTSLAATLPAQSITLFVLLAGARLPAPRAPANLGILGVPADSRSANLIYERRN